MMMSMMLKVGICLMLIISLMSYGSATSSASSIGNVLQNGVSSVTSSVADNSDQMPTTTTEPPYDPFRFLIMCSPGSKKRNTCEKCTKVTRDPNTYKMCCENKRGVRTWCEKFLNPYSWMKESDSIS